MDYYKTLGVERSATEDDIKKAYRKLAMKHHPDRNDGNKKSEEEFKKIGEAYATLSDTVKRREYDMMHSTSAFNQGNGGSTSFHADSFDDNDMHDFMNNVFGRRSPFGDIFGQQFQQKRTQRKIYSVQLSFWEAIFGADKQFEIIDENNIRKSFNISFPPALDDDTTIEIKIDNNETLILHINIEPDPHFVRNHLDLYTEIELPMSYAVLGGKLKFPHWEHEYEITIPPGTQQGQTLRLENAGIKKDIFVGDLYLKCNIVMPKKLTKKQKEIFEEYAKTEKNDNNFFDSLKQTWTKFFKK